MREKLSLPHASDAPRVKEAKEIVASALGKLDNAIVPWTLRLVEDRDSFVNGKRR